MVVMPDVVLVASVDGRLVVVAKDGRCSMMEMPLDVSSEDGRCYLCRC